MGKKQVQLTEKELRQKYNRWMKNFIKGINEICSLPWETQQYLWFCVLNECLYTTESNPFLAQMYKTEGLYGEEHYPILEDVHLAPMNRARLIEGMKTLLMNGGKKKWTDTLKQIENSSNKEDY